MSITTKRIFSALLGSLLVADGLYLVFHNKIDFWTIFPLVLGCFFLFYSGCYHKIHLFLARHSTLKTLWRFGWTGLIIWLSSLLMFFAYLHHNMQNSANIPAVPVIVVLGSGIENGRPSAILAQRLNTAAALAQQQPQAMMIVSGGLATPEHATEAEIMATYLQQTFHIPAKRINLETESTSTELNLMNSKTILRTHGISLNQPIAIVTSDFHTLRAAAIARKQGYQKPIMLSAPTPLLTRYHAWLREYFAFLSGWLLQEY